MKRERTLKLELLKREIEKFINHVVAMENASEKKYNSRLKNSWSLNSLRAMNVFTQFNKTDYDDEDLGNALTVLVREGKLDIVVCKSKISFYPLVHKW